MNRFCARPQQSLGRNSGHRPAADSIILFAQLFAQDESKRLHGIPIRAAHEDDALKPKLLELVG